MVIEMSIFTFAVGVEDRGIIGALKQSRGLSRENRLKLTALVIFAGVIGAISDIAGTVFDIAGSAIVGELIVNTINSILFVLLYGIITAAYLQIWDNGPGRGVVRVRPYRRNQHLHAANCDRDPVSGAEAVFER
jgi:hypothetical protein